MRFASWFARWLGFTEPSLTLAADSPLVARLRARGTGRAARFSGRVLRDLAAPNQAIPKPNLGLVSSAAHDEKADTESEQLGLPLNWPLTDCWHQGCGDYGHLLAPTAAVRPGLAGAFRACLTAVVRCATSRSSHPRMILNPVSSCSTGSRRHLRVRGRRRRGRPFGSSA